MCACDDIVIVVEALDVRRLCRLLGAGDGGAGPGGMRPTIWYVSWFQRPKTSLAGGLAGSLDKFSDEIMVAPSLLAS